MLAIDRPYVPSSVDGAKELCLEYGSETQLYLLPRVDHEERVRCMLFSLQYYVFHTTHTIVPVQVCVSLTQSRFHRTQVMTLDPTQDFKVSQVSLRCDSEGTIDFSTCPFRVRFIKMIFFFDDLLIPYADSQMFSSSL